MSLILVSCSIGLGSSVPAQEPYPLSEDEDKDRRNEPPAFYKVLWMVHLNLLSLLHRLNNLQSSKHNDE